jgi:hypothetical protein
LLRFRRRGRRSKHRSRFPVQESETEKIVTEGATGQDYVTVDDPGRLTEQQRAVQRTAGKASFFATMSILTVLVIDAWCVGKIQNASHEGSSTAVYLGVLLASLALKGYFTARVLGLAKLATEDGQRIGEGAYSANAKGARVANYLALAVSLIMLAVAVRIVA